MKKWDKTKIDKINQTLKQADAIKKSLPSALPGINIPEMGPPQWPHLAGMAKGLASSTNTLQLSNHAALYGQAVLVNQQQNAMNDAARMRGLAGAVVFGVDLAREESEFRQLVKSIRISPPPLSMSAQSAQDHVADLERKIAEAEKMAALEKYAQGRMKAHTENVFNKMFHDLFRKRP